MNIDVKRVIFMTLCHFFLYGLAIPNRLQHHALHTFMDAFQGCYKHKPYNFTALYIFVQIINVMIPPLLDIIHLLAT